MRPRPAGGPAGAADESVIVKGGRLRGERHCRASAERSSLQAIGEARGHCPLHNHALHNTGRPADVPALPRTRRGAAGRTTRYRASLQCADCPWRPTISREASLTHRMASPAALSGGYAAVASIDLRRGARHPACACSTRLRPARRAPRRAFTVRVASSAEAVSWPMAGKVHRGGAPAPVVEVGEAAPPARDRPPQVGKDTRRDIPAASGGAQGGAQARAVW